jgi:hypothetical protein
VEKNNPILWRNLAGQTAFFAVLAAVLMNLRRKRRSPSNETTGKD